MSKAWQLDLLVYAARYHFCVSPLCSSTTALARLRLLLVMGRPMDFLKALITKEVFNWIKFSLRRSLLMNLVIRLTISMKLSYSSVGQMNIEKPTSGNQLRTQFIFVWSCFFPDKISTVASNSSPSCFSKSTLTRCDEPVELKAMLRGYDGLSASS